MTDPTYALRPVDPEADAPLIHGWVSAPRARFWGMLEEDIAGVRAIYAYLAEQPHLTASLVTVAGDPVGIVQTYDPFVEEIGEHYDRRPGDLGVHLLLADDPARAGHTLDLVRAVVGRLLADPATTRLVMEPDVRNAASLALLDRLGASLGPVVRLPGKTARFAFLERPAHARASVASSTNAGSSSRSPYSSRS